MDLAANRSGEQLYLWQPLQPSEHSDAAGGALDLQASYSESQIEPERAAAACGGDVSGQGMIPPQLPGPLGRRTVTSEFAVAVGEPSGRVIGGISSKTWAQQTVEISQLQLALALRLTSAATCAGEPHFLDLKLYDSASYGPSSSGSAEAVSHRYWVNGCLSYFDKIPRGFYSIYGMDPYFWAVCSNLQESGRIPSLEALKTVDPVTVSSIEVISIDQQGDFSLKELLNRILALSFSCRTRREVVDHLAKLVCDRMGGTASNGEVELSTIWEQCSNEIKASLGSIVLPIGHLPLGLCRHRSLLFKVLADAIGLPCRIAKGCKYCTKADASSCLVQFGVDREYLVDLIGKPGCLYKPDSMVNGLSTILVASPMHFPQFKQVKPTIDYRSLARQYFLDFQSLDVASNNSSAASADGYNRNAMYPEPLERTHVDRISCISESSNQKDIYQWTPFAKVRNNEPFLLKTSRSQNDMYSRGMGKGALPLKFIPPIAHRDVQPLIDSVDPRDIVYKDTRYDGRDLLVHSKPSTQLAIGVKVLNIPWRDLVPRERIGAGSFGTVYRAQWNGFDVAVKILMEQNFQAEWMKEFLQEVAIMKRLRHPNIVLLIGAVTEPPYLSIVTEYMSRGSLYRLLHEPDTREILDERCRLRMAYDVASGMNYLHTRNPPIVHRDLKSPNLLVDSEYTVKVGDFGLSRSKANTFLSSKSAAGTPEWMAPEVLRNEQSDEKSDVYSFGVVLWELFTLQQPWADLKALQVVGAVGFQGKRLEIPQDMNRQLAALIESCWNNEPSRRPSFHSIMEALERLIELVPSTSLY